MCLACSRTIHPTSWALPLTPCPTASLPLQEFNTWFPLTMIIYVALLTLNWWERCCSRIFIANRFRFEAVRGGGGRGLCRRRAKGHACMGREKRTMCRLVASWSQAAKSSARLLSTHPTTTTTATTQQERADDEHTTRGQRLVQAEMDAISKGWPLGDGIGLFGVGSSRNGLPGAGGASGKARGAAPEQSVELNASAAAAGGRSSGRGGESPPPRAVSRAPLFGGASSSSEAAAAGGSGGSPPSKAAAIREKYNLQNRAVGSQGGPAAPVQQQWETEPESGSTVDALFAGVESRPARPTTGTQRLLDQPADSSSSSYAFSWKRGK